VKAAMRTFDRDCRRALVLFSVPNKWPFSTYPLSEMFRDFTQTDGGVGPNTWLFIVCGSCEELQQISINSPFTEFIDDR
jgi:hypothetical protein